MNSDFLRQHTPEAFHTPRLRLEKITLEHAPMLREAVLRDPPALRFVDWARGTWDPTQARRFCRGSREAMDRDGQFLTYLAFERERHQPDAPVTRRGRFVGLLDLHGFDFAVPACQIGYVGDPAPQGRGLMREAAAALVAQAHAWGVRRIEAWCDTRNTRSIRLAVGLGFVQEGCLRQAARDAEGLLIDRVVLARLTGDPLPAPRG